MWCCNCVHEVVDYGSAAIYKDLPNPEQIRAGVVPLDSLPANWWNALWADTNTAVIEARAAIGSFIEEFATVLNAANVQAVCTCVNNLYCAIEKIRTTIGNATVAGAVKSSTTPGEVSIDANGIMTANCVGNASNLSTSARTLVGAVNELKQVYDCCITELNACTCSLVDNKAPINHLSDTTCYGVGNAGCYGHVKLSDTYDTCVGEAADGIAASQAAVYNMFSYLSAHGGAVLGNTVACPLGVASAGTLDTAARSDHVHPEPVLKRYPTTFAGYLDCAWDSFISPNTYYEKEPGWCARPSTVWCCNWSCTTWNCNVTFIITDAMITSILSQNASSPIRYYHQNLCGDCKAYVLMVPIFQGSVVACTTYDASLRVCNCTSNSLLWFCGGVANTWSTRYACTLLYPGQSDYVYGKSYSPTDSHTVAYAYLVYIPTRRQGQPLTAENVGLALNETNRLSLTEGIACSIFTGAHR